MKTKTILLGWTSLYLCVGGFAAFGQGNTIAHHFGATNPTNEGFTSLVASGAVIQPTNDSGLDAWSILLPSSSHIANYLVVLTEQQSSALAMGWQISSTLRILHDSFPGPGFGVFAQLYTGSERYDLLFGLNAAGDVLVQVPTSLGPVYALSGSGAGFHNYRLIYDGTAGHASLWVDDEIAIENIFGHPDPMSPRFRWGGGQQPGVIHAHWHEVTLSVVPEPSALVLFGLGALLFSGYALRRRWQKS